MRPRGAAGCEAPRREVPRAQRCAAGSAKMHVAAFGGRAAAAPPARSLPPSGEAARIDDGAARLLAERRAVQALARRAGGAPSRCASASRSFRRPRYACGRRSLAGVAAFLKTDSAQRVPSCAACGTANKSEVDARDDRNAGAYGQPLPRRRNASGAAYRGQSVPSTAAAASGRDGDDIARSRECRDKPIVERRDSRRRRGLRPVALPTASPAPGPPTPRRTLSLLASITVTRERSTNMRRRLAMASLKLSGNSTSKDRLAAAPESGKWPASAPWAAPRAVLGFARAECRRRRR